MTETISMERDGAVATVILNRPAKLNAITLQMYDLLGEAFDRLSGDETVRCVVLRGAGESAFCAGSDIGEFDGARHGIEQAEVYARRTNHAIFKVRDCPHPTIALIKGVCVGGGLEIASLCDIRICGDSSRFGIPINRLGLTVDYEELELLVDLSGRRAALEILLEGRIFGAEEAWHKHLVSRVVPDGDVENEVYETARRIAATAPLVNRWHKKFARRLLAGSSLTDAERKEAFACYGTEDYRIGCDAFLAKKTPEFIGR